MTEPVPPSVPIIGEVVTPDIAAGKFGNGAWNLTNESVQEAQDIVAQVKRERKDERERLFHEEAKEALKESISYHRRIVRMGDAVLDKIELGGEMPSRAEMAILAQAQKSAVELVNRGIGKPKQVTEKNETKTLLGALLVRNET